MKGFPPRLSLPSFLLLGRSLRTDSGLGPPPPYLVGGRRPRSLWSGLSLSLSLSFFRQGYGIGVFSCLLALLCFALPCLALLCFALLCFALLGIALHCLALPCLALPCLALLCFALLACLGVWGQAPGPKASLSLSLSLSRLQLLGPNLAAGGTRERIEPLATFKAAAEDENWPSVAGSRQ